MRLTQFKNDLRSHKRICHLNLFNVFSCSCLLQPKYNVLQYPNLYCKNIILIYYKLFVKPNLSIFIHYCKNLILCKCVEQTAETIKGEFVFVTRKHFELGTYAKYTFFSINLVA